ncbi:MAG: ATP-binding protein [Candidatus Aminicenantes bacterium]|nr:MAG: ATP-binding protein [Candidatus Aminicenantes bacterium]
MFSVKEEENYIAFDLSSELRLVDRTIAESVTFLKNSGVRDDSNFKLVLREMLNNAIEHGNKNIIEKKVSCTITNLNPGQNSLAHVSKRFRIDVQDKGAGFNYHDLDFTLPEDPKQIRNRGFSLINAFADEIRFNEPGNKISVYLTFTQGTTFDIQEEKEKGSCVITPSGNLTAVVADQLREMLRELFDTGNREFSFDLKHVEDIDSICLSVLIVLYKTLTKSDNHYRLEIINVNEDLVNLFQLTRMDEIYIIKSGKNRNKLTDTG